MTERKIKKSLYDILESLDSIEDFLTQFLPEQRNYDAFVDSKACRRYVEREMEIIGEAYLRILRIESDYPLEPIRKIISLRNAIIHEYDGIHYPTLWKIICDDLPSLKIDVQQLMDGLPTE